MTRTNEDGAGPETKAMWSVVVVYDDTATRESAVTFCDQLVGRFWAKCEFEVSWWESALLEKPTAAGEATERAARADLVIFSSTPQGDFPLPVKAWVESWLQQRGDREGTLVGLMAPSEEYPGGEGQKHYYLRNAAHRGALDYLTHIPQDISRPIPDSLDSYTARADQVTSLLDDILRQQTVPPNLLV